ncbi:unnamed protein product [Alopecurus aequalis]
MARTGVGDRPGRRRRSTRRSSNTRGDDLFDDDNSELNSLSSGFDGTDIAPRDRLLDDALFGFFREQVRAFSLRRIYVVFMLSAVSFFNAQLMLKCVNIFCFMPQSVKSLKRNFSDFCKDFDITASNKDMRGSLDVADRSSFTMYSLKYFMAVIKKLTRQQRSVIEKFGFGCLLLLDLHEIPSEFARWVADCMDPVCSQMSVHCSTIDISERTFHVILGLPIGGLDIQRNSKDGEDFILEHFQLSAMPHITFFGNKLSGGDELSDHDVFVCFMAIAIHCFICPSSKDIISGKYLAVFKHPDAARGYDFCKLVYDHCLSGIIEFSTLGKLKGRRLRAHVCCNYALAVRYLDCLDFGRQNVDQLYPRISVWKGHMIKFYSELDRKGRNKYGKRPLKGGIAPRNTDDLNVKNSQSPTFQQFTADFRNNVHRNFASNLKPEIIDGILNIAQNVALCSSTARKRKNEILVNNVLDFLRKSSLTCKPADINCVEPEAKIPTLNAPDNNICEKAKPVHAEQSHHPPAANNFASDVFFQEEMKYSTDPATPECMITKVVGPNNQMSAPEMKPLKKVKSRKCRLISAKEEEILYIDSTMGPSLEAGRNFIDLSPISRINLVESPCVKPCTGDFNIKRCNTIKENGSKQAPILVAEVSPNPNVTHGSNDFRRRCSELARKNDIMYNKLLSNQHENSRFAVSDEDIINYSAIIELGHSAKHMKTMGVLYPEVHCNYQSLGESLKPEGEVDNFLFTCFCRMVFKEKHPASSGRHYFFPHIGDAILKCQSFPNDYLIRTTFEGAAKASKGRNLGCVDNTLFFPIIDSHHWFVFAVDFKYRVFAFLDSFHDKNSDFHVRKKELLIDNFVHLWELFVSRDHNFGDFRSMYPHVPKQGTSLHDCGVFCMKFMECWKPYVDMRKLFSLHDILNIRIQYAIKLYFQSHNETDQSLVTGYYSMV